MDQSLICQHRNLACNGEEQKIILIKLAQGDLNEFVILTLFNEPAILNPLYQMTTDRNNYYTRIIRRGHLKVDRPRTLVCSILTFSLSFLEES